MDQNSQYGDYDEHEYWAYQARAQKKVRIRQAFLGVSFVIANIFFFSALYGDDRVLGFIRFPQSFSYLWATIFFLVFLGGLTYLYVQEGLGVERLPSGLKFLGGGYLKNNYEDRILELELVISEMSEKLQSFDLGNRDALIEETVGVIKATAHEKIWEELSASVSKTGTQSRALAPIEKEYEKSKQRLLAEVKALGKRGSVNLALGVVTTATALLILSSLALSSINPELYKPSGGDFKVEVFTLSMFFVPKISLAIFIQIFSLFFLKLYKAGLAEIKYFQNEITNLELKYFGIVTSIIAEDKEAISSAGRLLLEVERNHVLTAGQTTVELEKHKIEQSSSSEMMKLLPKLLSRKPV